MDVEGGGAFTFLGEKSWKISIIKCVTFLRGEGGGSPEERPYDVSRGQNRYVTLPLT